MIYDEAKSTSIYNLHCWINGWIFYVFHFSPLFNELLLIRSSLSASNKTSLLVLSLSFTKWQKRNQRWIPWKESVFLTKSERKKVKAKKEAIANAENKMMHLDKILFFVYLNVIQKQNKRTNLSQATKLYIIFYNRKCFFSVILYIYYL